MVTVAEEKKLEEGKEKRRGAIQCTEEKKREENRRECKYLPRVPILINETPAGASVAKAAATRTPALRDVGLRDRRCSSTCILKPTLFNPRNSTCIRAPQSLRESQLSAVLLARSAGH